jgi:hypothetical protein
MERERRETDMRSRGKAGGNEQRSEQSERSCEWGVGESTLPLRSKFIRKAVKGKKEKGRHARRGGRKQCRVDTLPVRSKGERADWRRMRKQVNGAGVSSGQGELSGGTACFTV